MGMICHLQNISKIQRSWKSTLPETNSKSAPENQWLQSLKVLLSVWARPISTAFAVSFMECRDCNKPLFSWTSSFINQILSFDYTSYFFFNGYGSRTIVEGICLLLVAQSMFDLKRICWFLGMYVRNRQNCDMYFPQTLYMIWYSDLLETIPMCHRGHFTYP